MPLPSSVAEVSVAYQRDVDTLTRAALGLVGPAIARSSTPAAWQQALVAIGDDLLALQVAAASLADPYLTDTLQAQGASDTANASVAAEGFQDMTDGGGSWLRLLLFAPNAVGSAARGLVAHSIAMNGIQDVARASVQAGMQARPAVTRYVRQLSPPSCARCAILAGRVYHSMTAFERHPRCDCINVPDAGQDDWQTNPRTYFNSLSPADQDAIFGIASAKAIRDGSDMAQVVNARSGITTMNVFGRDVLATTQGTTKRALFGGYEILPDGSMRRRKPSEFTRAKGQRYFRAKQPRLLPDEIYKLAGEFGWDRAEVLRQLRRFAYLR